MIKSFSVNLLIMVCCVVCSTLFRGHFANNVRTARNIHSSTVAIENTAGSVTLDCPVQYKQNEDEILIFKWFHNNHPQHIYQWIVKKNLRYFSPKIKHLVDLNYAVDDNATRYRALRFVDLASNLNGNYTCTAVSLNNHTNIHIQLIIYVRAKEFDVEVTRAENGFNVTCYAIGLYPMPELTLFRYLNNDSNAIQITQNTTVVTQGESGQYSIWLTSIISENTSASADISNHYGCKLQLPKTNYMQQKIVYLQAGWNGRPHHHSSSNKSVELQFALLVASLVLPLLVVINIS